jgi:uncharacterized protein (DUF934 family)
MRNLLRQREIVEDDWQYLGEEPPGGSESIIIPLAELRDNAATWCAWRGRLGVRLAPADRVETLAADLTRLALVAVEFPSPSEGRGYTQASLLRSRYGFRGELRAVGAVKRDQVFFMSRCGIDSFELAAGEDLNAAKASLGKFTIAYQPSAAAHSPDGRGFRP